MEGVLIRTAEYDPLPHLQLGEVVLNSGHPLDVLIAGHWIAGHVEAAYFGKERRWHLDTNDDNDPAILLRPGIRARIEEEEL